MRQVLLAPNGRHGCYVVIQDGKMRVIDLPKACKRCSWAGKARCPDHRDTAKSQIRQPWEPEAA